MEHSVSLHYNQIENLSPKEVYGIYTNINNTENKKQNASNEEMRSI